MRPESAAGPAARLRRESRLFFVALQFLTRLPIPRRVGFEPAWLHASARYFPLVGLLVGALGAAVLWAAHGLWPASVAATLCVAFTVWLTAAFHEDGLADTFDALLGAAPRERALAIMKDSRIGSFGAAALALVLLLRILLLAELLAQGAAAAACALVASHMLARAATAMLMVLLPYAGDAEHAKARPLARELRRSDALLAVASCLLLGLLPSEPARCVGSAAAALAVVLAMRAWLRRRLGGYTGDTLGATEQLAETAVLMAFLGRIPP